MAWQGQGAWGVTCPPWMKDLRPSFKRRIALSKWWRLSWAAQCFPGGRHASDLFFHPSVNWQQHTLLHSAIKLLAAEAEIAADFLWSLAKPSLARPMSYARRDLRVPWKQSKPETFLQNLLTFSTTSHFRSRLARLDLTLLSLHTARNFSSLWLTLVTER